MMQATSLHDCPAELLRQIAVLTNSQPSRQALRSSSKVLRDALNPRIHACTVDVTNSDAQDCSGDECGARVQAGMKQLARFPAACTLTSFSWGLEHWKPERSDDDCRYSEPDFHEEMQAGILCQQVLTGFVAAAGTRLSTVQRLSISTRYAVGYGEVLSITVACPSLKHLRLSDCTLVGPVFAPLARLTSFSSLDIDCTSTAGSAGPACVAWSDSLAGLSSSLTELTFSPEYLEYTRTYEHEVDLFACIGRLTALRRLEVRYDLSKLKISVGIFSSLVHLTELSLPRLCSLQHCLSLACASSSLTSLDLSSATLDSPAIRMLAAMPNLSDLHVQAFEPDCDLSEVLQCSWKRVRILSSTHPRQLAWLPLAGAVWLDVRPSWKLRSDVGDVCDEVRRACLLLAKISNQCTLTPRRRHTIVATLYDSDKAPGRSVSLGWGEPPAPAPSEAQQLAVLDAMLPLRHVALELSLGEQWDLGAEEAKALAQALPRLHTLDMRSTPGSRTVDFITVLAQQGLPTLRHLRVAQLVSRWGQLSQLAFGQLAADMEGALLALAKEMLLKGQALRVSVMSLPAYTQTRLNSALNKAWQEAGMQGAPAGVAFDSRW